ncbi:MAG: MerR family transcriptional regulator [Caldilineaceae bacterium]|nr:MerR family transcriptional regulator [Caldilineaceae bacterium]
MSTDKLYTVAEAAALAGVSASTVRNWAGQFAGHLSIGANPPPGTERLFAAGDVAILQQIQQLRLQHVSYSEIPDRLQAIDQTDLQPYIDVAAEPPPAPPEPTQDIVTALAIIQAIDGRYSELERRIANQEANQNSRFVWFAYGILAGLLLAVFAVLFLWLGSLAH